jgi:tetrahydromethanopterin S-methyltransferase subunit C
LGDNVTVGSASRSHLFAVWYLCISAGFVLLGLRAMLVGAPMWTVILRWVIAGGFLALALLQRRDSRR